MAGRGEEGGIEAASSRPTSTGNHASTEAQKDLGVEYIRALRWEMNRPYTVAFNQTLTLMGFMVQTRYSAVINNWGHFEMVSKEVQARIFSTIMQGLSVLIQNTSMGYEDMLYFIKAFYPEGPVQTKEQLKAAMTEMLKDHTLQLKGGDVYGETDDDLAEGDGDAMRAGCNLTRKIGIYMLNHKKR
jgi:hypothetical protein